MVRIVVTPEAQLQFENLPVVAQTRVEKLFQRLAHWPNVSGVKALRGDLTGRFRLRTGDYRVQFHVTREVVVVEKVGHRDGFYGE